MSNIDIEDLRTTRAIIQEDFQNRCDDIGARLDRIEKMVDEVGISLVHFIYKMATYIVVMTIGGTYMLSKILSWIGW
jgi:hypothetical protein